MSDRFQLLLTITSSAPAPSPHPLPPSPPHKQTCTSSTGRTFDHENRPFPIYNFPFFIFWHVPVKNQWHCVYFVVRVSLFHYVWLECECDVIAVVVKVQFRKTSICCEYCRLKKWIKTNLVCGSKAYFPAQTAEKKNKTKQKTAGCLKQETEWWVSFLYF